MKPRQPQPLDSTVLRRIAETVHALRSPTPEYVVVQPPSGEGERKYEVQAAPVNSADVINIPVQNPPAAVPAVRMTDFDVDYRFRDEKGRRRISELFPKALPDAVFWTESAVQKFMFPYYASKLSSHQDVTALLQELLDAMRPRDAEGQGGGAVVGLVHLPYSEYSMADVADGIGVLECTFPKDASEPELRGMTLAELRRRRAAEG